MSIYPQRALSSKEFRLLNLPYYTLNPIISPGYLQTNHYEIVFAGNTICKICKKQGVLYMTTSLIFILVVAIVLILLVYWVLNTLSDDKIKSESRDFKFENAAELAVDSLNEFYLAQNTIKIQGENGYGTVYWLLSREKWNEVNAEHGLKPDMENLVLRVTEASERVHNSDMKVKTIAGQYRFRMQPKSVYYVTLAIKNRKLFIPVLTSNSVSAYG
jgi:hypothetical protein